MAQPSSSLNKFVGFVVFLMFGGLALYGGYDHYKGYLAPDVRQTIAQTGLIKDEPPPSPGPLREPDIESIQVEPSSSSFRAPDGRITTPIERKSNELLVGFLDVGQGDAIFIQTPDNTNLLIDSGEGDYTRQQQNINAVGTIIKPFLNKNNIDQLDYYISTHPHSDHMGSAADLVYQVGADRAIISGKTNTTTTYEMMLESFEHERVSLNQPASTDGNLNIGDELPVQGATLKLLRHDPDARTINNASLTFLLSKGSVEFLLTGDMERPGEQELLRQWKKELDADVLKVGHHGSRSSSSEEFVEAAEPDHAVVMVGGYNSYGHPAPRTLSKLKSAGAKIHRTDKHGSIFMSTDGKKIRYLHTANFSAVK